MVSAINEADLYNQLQTAKLELVSFRALKQGGSGFSFSLGTSIKTRDLIQLFTHLEQMQSAGVPMLEALGDIRDTTENTYLRDIMSEICRDVSDGNSLSEAMSNHPKIFKNLYISLISAGENTGDLTSSYKQLIKYLKFVDEMQTKIKKATRYPMVLLFFVIVAMVVMMGFVVPKITEFIKNLDQELPFYTVALIATSEFFVHYWWAVLIAPIITFIVFKTLRSVSNEFKYRTDQIALKLPIAGELIRKINVARFAQTFGALYQSGIDVIQALAASRKTVGNMALAEALETVEHYVKSGMPVSESLNLSGEFPSMVVRMVKIGEESGNLTGVLNQVSDFYTKDVDDTIQAIITAIEPTLTALLGGMIAWIAAGVFGPVYESFQNLDI